MNQHDTPQGRNADVNIPPIEDSVLYHKSKLSFGLNTLPAGGSAIQSLDFAFAAGIIEEFMNDHTLVLTIRGRKRAPEFEFAVGEHTLTAKGVQIEMDAVYEGENQIVLVKTKKIESANFAIHQLFYPYRFWRHHTDKPVSLVVFEKKDEDYLLWEFGFKSKKDYNSIELIKTARYRMC